MDEPFNSPLMRMPSRQRIVSLIQQVQQGLSQVELVYAPHEEWPLSRPAHRPHRSAETSSQTKHKQPIKVSVLDSSFNPPTLAHLALVNAPRPRYEIRGSPSSGDSSLDPSPDYDAKLLLLSVRNADKVIKRSDASLVQRLEMMMLLTKDIKCRASSRFEGLEAGRLVESISAPSQPEAPLDGNTAVAIIDEPTFVGKSTNLLKFVQDRLADIHSSQLPTPPRQIQPYTHDTELTFLLGFDTLERLLSPRYYVSAGPPDADPAENMMKSLRRFLFPPPDGEGSRVVCARRISTPASALTSISLRRGTGDAAVSFDSHDVRSSTMLTHPNPEEVKTLVLAQEFIASDRVVMIDIGEQEQTFSSSAVRELVRATSDPLRRVGRTGRDDSSGGTEGSWRSLVSDRIAAYVLTEGLYQDTEQPSS